jgi:hypothetical protein
MDDFRKDGFKQHKFGEAYGHDQPDTYFDQYAFLGGKNYQEWFVCLPKWPLPYRDGHFKLAQLLVHIRTTEGIDHDGKPLLKIQRPWHADIRKYGNCIQKKLLLLDRFIHSLVGVTLSDRS